MPMRGFFRFISEWWEEGESGGRGLFFGAVVVRAGTLGGMLGDWPPSTTLRGAQECIQAGARNLP